MTFIPKGIKSRIFGMNENVGAEETPVDDKKIKKILEIKKIKSIFAVE